MRNVYVTAWTFNPKKTLVIDKDLRRVDSVVTDSDIMIVAGEVLGSTPLEIRSIRRTRKGMNTWARVSSKDLKDRAQILFEMIS